MVDREEKKEEMRYIAIDLKSFYASVECRERNLDPMTTNLVVADAARTEKTICLAVSPTMKAYGLPGRARLFEVVQKIKEVNSRRQRSVPGGSFTGSSDQEPELTKHPELEVGYITAPPRMALYMEYSTRIYNIYLKYIAPEDIHVYSIDEVFMDVGPYLRTYKMNARQLAQKLIREVMREVGITATAGVGSNLYLCKVAMDIVAKHMPADENGVRIAQLDEDSYRRLLWNHQPLKDFWRVGTGYQKKLKAYGLYTMGDIARCSLGKPGDFYNEDLLYRLFGVNAELLIDHAWGWEPCTIAQIKAYKPSSNSVGSGQVLQCPYTFEKARLIVQEMTDLLVLDLVERRLVTDQLTLTVGYDRENLTDAARRNRYKGEVTIDRHGRQIPKHAHGTVNLEGPCSSTRKITEAVLGLYDRIMDQELLVRRIYVTANRVQSEEDVAYTEPVFEQMDLFTDYEALEKKKEQDKKQLQKERNVQEAMLEIKKKFGKNAVLRGMNLQEGATARDRNRQIGGHKA